MRVVWANDSHKQDECANAIECVRAVKSFRI